MSPSAPSLPIAFPGAPGAYSEAAARRLYGATAITMTCDDLAGAACAVRDGRARAAIVPLENSITGPFVGLADALAATGLLVEDEVLLPVRHCLMASPGTRFDEVRVVASHASALAHCRDWLASWGVATRATRDTALAALELAEAREAGVAVIGGRALAEIYGLDVLAEGISDHVDNRTRFLALCEQPADPSAGRRSALLLGPLETPRGLKSLRIQLEARGARRVRVPVCGSADGRHALGEFDHAPGAGERLMAEAAGEMGWRYLGSWTPPS